MFRVEEVDTSVPILKDLTELSEKRQVSSKIRVRLLETEKGIKTHGRGSKTADLKYNM